MAARRPVELSKNVLQNLFYNMTPQSVPLFNSNARPVTTTETIEVVAAI